MKITKGTFVLFLALISAAPLSAHGNKKRLGFRTEGPGGRRAQTRAFTRLFARFPSSARLKGSFSRRDQNPSDDRPESYPMSEVA